VLGQRLGRDRREGHRAQAGAGLGGPKASRPGPPGAARPP
jgi:hypothetical protein